MTGTRTKHPGDGDSLLDFPPIPQGVFGVCEGCDAVAWELLDGRSTYCLGCDSAAYRDDDEWDECGSCSCVVACEGRP